MIEQDPFYHFSTEPRTTSHEPLHLLYLGRRHPLKGLEYLEAAVRQIEKDSAPLRLCVRIISNAFGEELEKVWDWCDVLVLPTLSENFGLVIAEALERGKRVITTDGAPAWNHEIHETHEKWLGRVEGMRCGDNTFLMTNDLLRPDCNFVMKDNEVRPICDRTDKDLRLGHNIEKLYRGGAFE